MDVSEETLLWEQWFASDDKPQRLKDQLFETYRGWVEMEAKQLYFKLSFLSAELADFIQYGHLGLIEAISRFQQREIKFKSYAIYRVKGAILNSVFKFSEQSSFYFKKNNGTDFVQNHLDEQQLEAEDSLTEAIMWFTLEYYLSDVSKDMEEQKTVASMAYTSPELDKLQVEVEEKKQGLSFMENQVLEMSYKMGMSYQQIADVFDLTKGRVGQIHGDAMKKLRVKLRW